MSAEKYALPLPEAIQGAADDGATAEILRLWWKGDRPEMSVRPAMSDMRLMGRILAEVSWNLASAHARVGDAALGEAVRQLREGWLQGHADADKANPGVAK